MVYPDFEIRRSILVGDTAEAYLQRTLTILRTENINPVVTLEFSPESEGIFSGLAEARSLLGRILPETGSEVWAVSDGDAVDALEVALRVKAPFGSIGLYETALCGVLASSMGWATAARECVDAAAGTPIISLGARDLHPNVAANMDYSAVVGGCVSCSTVHGARLAGVTPAGNMSHALPVLMTDTVRAMESFDRHLPQEVPRIALVGSFKDEAEEALDVARSLREKLRGIQLDTPFERGGVTTDLIKEVRARLDQAGFTHVEITVSGGLTPERIRRYVAERAPVDTFGVGCYIGSAKPMSFRADIHEVDGRPMARRGRIPGLTVNPRLDRIM